MGDSTYTPQGEEEITIELYARDVLDLLIHLQWKRLAICGFSMGGTQTPSLPLPLKQLNSFFRPGYSAASTSAASQL